jgi:hypothetical protein
MKYEGTTKSTAKHAPPSRHRSGGLLSQAIDGSYKTIIIVMLIWSCGELASRAQAQKTAKEPSDQQLLDTFTNKLPEEILQDYFKDPPYPIFAIRRLMDLGDPSVIPRLEQAFEKERHDPAREFLAAALVELGDSKATYYNYVLTRAETAITSTLPLPVRLGARTSSGAAFPPLTRGFRVWVRQHDCGVSDALWRATFDAPAAVEALGEAADKRSQPALLEGLKSPNILVEFAAALGLARLQDAASVAAIVAAAKRRRTPEERRMLAKVLLYFPDSLAQKTSERLIHNPVLLLRWRQEVGRRGWRRAMRDTGG